MGNINGNKEIPSYFGLSLSKNEPIWAQRLHQQG